MSVRGAAVAVSGCGGAMRWDPTSGADDAPASSSTKRSSAAGGLGLIAGGDEIEEQAADHGEPEPGECWIVVIVVLGGS